MGDDPFVPSGIVRGGASSGHGGSSATGGHNITNNITNFGRTSQVLMVIGMGLSLGLSIGAIIIVTLGRITDREAAREARAAIEARMVDMVQASEKRAMDYAGIAEREARVSQDRSERLEVGLHKAGIKINSDGH